MSYTVEDLAAMPDHHLLNIITSVCDSGVSEYLQKMQECKAELARRGKQVCLIRVESELIPGKWGHKAVLF